MSKLKIRQVRSTNECKEDQRATVRALGLLRIRDTVVHDDTPQIRGMINKVDHLVEVEEMDQ
ncbi:MAG: 50S ribosomal protein L30 [Bacteroidetes bacterium QH_2_63_10]|jgi:large subunit ribosomal protein L30|nr:MAG: 50S ribosomal protein L30 [Bacteroidetes bacterium QH_2_63_10]